MCGTKSTAQVCGRPVADYLTASKAGIKPQVVFCDEIRGTILNALLDRADKAPKLAYKPSERPGFDKEITKQPEHYWPLLARCHLNHGILRQGIDHRAFTATPCRWVRTNGTPFKSDAEAGEWLHKQQKDAQDNPDWKAQPARPKPVGTLTDPRWATRQALPSSQDSSMPSLAKLSLDDRVDAPPVVVRDTNPMPRKPLFTADRRSVSDPQKLKSLGNTVETQKRPTWQTIYQWTRDASMESIAPSSKKEELRDTLEKLGRERQARLRQIKQISEQEAKSVEGL
ncbi:hypothetical protein FSOLCH5_008864 [Fusarium solani]